MIYWSIKIIIISFSLIFLIHHLISYFTSMLTIPKEKDIYTSTNIKYELMNNLLKGNSVSISDNADNPQNSNNELLKENNMKDELKYFLKSQMTVPKKFENEDIGYTELSNLKIKN